MHWLDTGSDELLERLRVLGTLVEVGHGVDRSDPFEGSCLDEEFVRSAAIKGRSAAERVHYRVPESTRHRAPGGRHARRRRRQRRLRRFRRRLPGGPVGQRRVAMAIAVVPVAALTLSWARISPSAEVVRIAPSTADLSGYRPSGPRYPPPDADRSDHPLGTPPPVPAEHGDFAFSQLQEGSDEPVAWDPCRPVHLVVNTRTAPPDGLVLVREAAASVAAATGLHIVIDGTTTERLGRTRRPIQGARYGDRWAPVLVAFTDEKQISALDFDVVGVGGSRALPLASGDRVYVTGAVALDGPQLAHVRGGFGGRDGVRAVIEHELGHVVGLGHVPDSSQLMSEDMHAGVESFGSGDRAGLARLGAGRCYAYD